MDLYIALELPSAVANGKFFSASKRVGRFVVLSSYFFCLSLALLSSLSLQHLAADRDINPFAVSSPDRHQVKDNTSQLSDLPRRRLHNLQPATFDAPANARLLSKGSKLRVKLFSLTSLAFVQVTERNANSLNRPNRCVPRDFVASVRPTQASNGREPRLSRKLKSSFTSLTPRWGVCRIQTYSGVQTAVSSLSSKVAEVASTARSFWLR